MDNADSKEKREEYVAGLLRERKALEARGLTARVSEIDEELRRVKGEAPAKRAAKRA